MFGLNNSPSRGCHLLWYVVFKCVIIHLSLSQRIIRYCHCLCFFSLLVLVFFLFSFLFVFSFCCRRPCCHSGNAKRRHTLQREVSRPCHRWLGPCSAWDDVGTLVGVDAFENALLCIDLAWIIFAQNTIDFTEVYTPVWVFISSVVDHWLTLCLMSSFAIPAYRE